MPRAEVDNIDDVFEAFNKPDVPGCAIAVMKNGEVIHTAGYGSGKLDTGFHTHDRLSRCVGIKAVHVFCDSAIGRASALH